MGGMGSAYKTLPENLKRRGHLGIVWNDWGHAVHSWLRHYATSRKVTVSIPDEVIRFFNWRNLPSRTMTLWSNQPLAEMSNLNLPGGKGRLGRKADNLIAICEPIIWKM
jgi:hypothetical protein